MRGNPTSRGMLKMKVGRFADGDYGPKCQNCGCTFTGDKLATLCLPCAVGEIEEQNLKFYKALRDIDRRNDHPSRFDRVIKKILDDVLDLPKMVVSWPD